MARAQSRSTTNRDLGAETVVDGRKGSARVQRLADGAGIRCAFVAADEAAAVNEDHQGSRAGRLRQPQIEIIAENKRTGTLTTSGTYRYFIVEKNANVSIA